MATLTFQEIVRAGLNTAYTACAAGGDDFANTGNEITHIKNAHSSALVVTYVTAATVDGLAVADRTVSIPAGEERMIGPFPKSTYDDENGKVQITYSGVTLLTIAIIRQGS